MPDVPQNPPIDQILSVDTIYTLTPILTINSSGNSAGAYVMPEARRYTGARVFATVTNLLAFRAGTTGTIVAVNVWCGTNTSATSAIFNLRINGSGQWAGASRLVVAQNTSSAAKANQSIAVTIGDLLELAVEQVPDIGIGTPVDFLVRIQVG